MNVLAINNLPRSSKTGKGGTGLLTKWNTMFCLQAGQPHYVMIQKEENLAYDKVKLNPKIAPTVRAEQCACYNRNHGEIMSRQHPVKIQEKMLKLFDEGKSAREISRQLNLYPTSVTRVLKRHGRKMSDGKGKNHSGWKGGRGLKSGYWTVYAPNHPRALNNRRVWEHILIMEKHLGRPISKDEHIHHIDFNRQNNDVENLYVCSSSDHSNIHGSLESVVKDLLNQEVVKFKDGEYYV